MAETSRARAPGTAASHRRWTVRRIAAVVLGVLAIVFIAENNAQTDIRVIVPVVSMPLWLALLGVGVVSFAIGWLVAGRR